MNIFINFWTNWTVYEKISTSLTLLFIFLIISFSVRLITKNIQLTLVSMFSLVISGLLTTLSLWFINEVFGIKITTYYLLIPTIITFINFLNIGTFVGYYSQNYKSKDFDVNDIKRDHVSDTIKLTILIALFFSVLSVFITQHLLFVVSISGLISLTQIWINYYLLYKLVK